MKKFEIEFIGRVKIKAKDFDHAKKKINNRHPEYLPTEIIDLDESVSKDVIGRCEASDLPVYDDDDYYVDEEGCLILKEFYE